MARSVRFSVAGATAGDVAEALTAGVPVTEPGAKGLAGTTKGPAGVEGRLAEGTVAPV